MSTYFFAPGNSPVSLLTVLGFAGDAGGSFVGAAGPVGGAAAEGAAPEAPPTTCACFNCGGGALSLFFTRMEMRRFEGS